ncbi:MAG: amino acid adenylation domain-containing protein, partial [Candidatus Sulfotelmatobacter sp.]
TLERYREYFLRLVEAMVADDAQTIDRLPMVSEEERERVLYEWNETKAEFPSDKCVHELFEEQVHRTPNATAVRCGEDSLCYIELDQRANQLAHYLKQMGVGPEVLVGICLNRSLDMLVALLGILKSGGVYVPLDPSYPVERLGFMLEDAQIPILLTQASLRGSLPKAMVQIVSMDEDWKDIAANSIARVEGSVHGSNLAYVIYTSGSTGQPKGVGVTHKGMVNYVNWARQAYKMSQGSGSPVYSSLAFDLTITSIYPALLGGGCVEVLPQSAGMEELAQRLESSDYSLLKLTPSHLRMLSLLLEKSERGERGAWALIIGGEALRYADLELWRKPGSRTRLINEYGPTETVVGSSIYEVEDERESGDVPVGKPIANTQVYVVDEEMEPVPVGVSGELYIGGVGLARGYLNRPELTAERFVPDPFVSKNTVGGERLYRTGDLVRWQGDGNLEYLGRLDQQVKIRGFRIELEEIEAVLETHPSVARCVVLAREDQPGDRRLVAYLVNKTDVVQPNASVLEEYLKVSLPDYMVPSAYVQLDELPLNHNGKIDRKALPQPDRGTPEEEYVGPRDPIEETLCGLWQEVLRRERVGVHDDFFKMGGHSLLAVQLTSRVRSAFAIEMPLSVLFAAPTAARMAEHIASVNGRQRPQSSQVLVSIQSQGSRVPFFCVHAVGGQVISYAELSQELGLEQPFYGLQSPPANYFPESGVSIEQLATLYNQEIRRVQPRGPYLLSGWSMGGLVAWEMAQQLIKEGETIGLLALMDTTPPSGYLEADDTADEVSMLARFALDMSRLVGKDPRPLVEQFSRADAQDQWKMVQETLTSYGVLAPKTAHAEMTALLNVFTRNALAMNNYSLHPSDQSVVYIRASETPERFSKLWTKWSGGGIQFHLVPGDHFTMLRRPNVRIIAETLQRYISTNSNNESRAVSPEMSHRELIDVESQHTR